MSNFQLYKKTISATGTTVENEPIIKSDGASSNVMQWLSNDESSNVTISEDDSNNLDLVVSAGNVGVGATPNANWSGTGVTLQLGNTAHMTSSNDWLYNGSNYYYSNADADRWRYATSAAATKHTQGAGSHTFSVAASGVADAAIDWTDALTISSAGLATFSNGIAVTGNITAPTNPAFSVKLSTNQVNIATTGVATVLFDTERFDQGANFNTGTYTFTAPVTGTYQLSAHLRLDNVDIAATFYQVTIVTSNKSYCYTVTPLFTSDASYMSAAFSVLADMDAADTAYVTVAQSGGTSQTDIESIESFFSGFLAC